MNRITSKIRNKKQGLRHRQKNRASPGNPCTRPTDFFIIPCQDAIFLVSYGLSGLSGLPGETPRRIPFAVRSDVFPCKLLHMRRQKSTKKAQKNRSAQAPLFVESARSSVGKI
jgi:hypothetical protein